MHAAPAASHPPPHLPRRLWRSLLRLAVTLALLGGAHSAQALCIAILGCSCSAITSTASLTFPNYNPLSSGTLSTASTVQVKCGGVAGLAIPYKIHLGKGGGTSYSARRLASGSNLLSYNLYTDNTYTAIWGDKTGGSSEVTGIIGLDVLGLSPPAAHTIYALLPGGQTTAVPATTYTDTITVTVTYE